MVEPKKRTPHKLESTLHDPALTNTLAARVRREVALERANDGIDIEVDEETSDVVVVLGPDGVPQIADDVDSAPDTVRLDVDHDPKPADGSVGSPSKK